MADTQETIADIIAEKRRRADAIERDCAEKMKRGEMVSDRYARELVADIRREADRLDAAHKREVAVSKTETTTGDAKLREALAAYLALWDNGTMNNLDELKRVIKQMREALSAPPRNCDVAKVAEDPWRAWLDDKTNWNEDGNPRLEIHDWLLAPATEKEGGDDGNE